MNWSTKNIPSQAGRRILITGANSGIGFETALALAKCEAEVILASRSEEKTQEAIRQIKSQVPSARLQSIRLDLSSLTSIHDFAKFYGQCFPGQSLDVLINNAGIMNIPQRTLTVDGFEQQWATNFMGPFVLSALLYPHLKQQIGTRVVTVASKIVHFGKIDFDNLQSERKYRSFYGTYAQSKLADLIFMLELQRRLSAVGSRVISVGAHPGIASTQIGSQMNVFLRKLTSILSPMIAQDAAQGALPTLFAAVSSHVVPGGYYGPNKCFEQKGFPASAGIPSQAIDGEVAQRLWELTEQLTGVSFLVE